MEAETAEPKTVSPLVFVCYLLSCQLCMYVYNVLLNCRYISETDERSGMSVNVVDSVTTMCSDVCAEKEEETVYQFIQMPISCSCQASVEVCC